MYSGKKFAYKKKTKFRNLVKIFRIGNIIFDKINSRSHAYMYKFNSIPKKYSKRV